MAVVLGGRMARAHPEYARPVKTCLENRRFFSGNKDCQCTTTLLSRRDGSGEPSYRINFLAGLILEQGCGRPMATGRTWNWTSKISDDSLWIPFSIDTECSRRKGQASV